jgi:SAM-dependent methyltransferase
MLKSLARRVVDGLLLRRLPGPFVRESGRCWVASLPGCAPGDPSSSPLTLYEDGVALRPARAALDDVRATGFGAYRHDGGRLYFSTSDNSNPNDNGRVYRFALSMWLYRRRVERFGPDGGDLTRPITLRRPDAGPARVRADVADALRRSRSALDHARRLLPSLAGRTVLEVGPGINCGAALVLAAHGARPVVLDRFLAPWDLAYHPAFYAALADELARQDTSADVRPLRAVAEAGGYPPDVLRRVEAPLEEVLLEADSVDVVLSNAVLEHLYDLPRALAALCRITRPGGVGLHQVDHRDHRDFDQPLEYLLAGEDDFRRLFDRCHGECGNRHRPDEVADAFRAAGFDVLDVSGNLIAEAAYLRRFLPRLRAARSRYRGWPAEGLRVVSAFFRVRKPSA